MPEPTTDLPLQVEIFRAGNYGAKGVYTEDDLARIAADYDPALHEAPVTFDHEQTGPAQGWVKSLSAAGERLFATIVKASDALREALSNQSYKKRSVELYRAFAETGAPYLKAVSFLGAAAPEVKGMSDPLFTETIQYHDRLDDRTAAFAAVKERLTTAGVWRPEWETRGLEEIFARLEGTPEHTLLTEFLAAEPQAAPFGRMANDAPAGPAAAVGEMRLNGASPLSIQRHRQALQFMREQPGVEYRDALLKTTTLTGHE